MLEPIAVLEGAVVTITPCVAHSLDGDPERQGEHAVVRAQGAKFQMSLDSETDTRMSWIYLTPDNLREAAEQMLIVADMIDGIGGESQSA